MRRHRPPTRDLQAAPKTSKPPPWGSENPGAVLIEDVGSTHSHKGSNVCYLQVYYLQVPKQGHREPREGQSSSPSEQEKESKQAKEVGIAITNSSWAQIQVVILKGTLGKADGHSGQKT